MTQRGVAMVELAIVLPLLLMLLFGITELGRALYQQNSLYKAVSTGARYLARANNVLAFDNKGNCTSEGAWPDATTRTEAENLIIYGHTTATGTPLIPHLDDSGAITIDVKLRPLTKTNNSTIMICVVTVDAEATFAGFFGDIVIPFTTLETFNIRAETEERYIGN